MNAHFYSGVIKRPSQEGSPSTRSARTWLAHPALAVCLPATAVPAVTSAEKLPSACAAAVMAYGSASIAACSTALRCGLLPCHRRSRRHCCRCLCLRRLDLCPNALAFRFVRRPVRLLAAGPAGVCQSGQQRAEPTVLAACAADVLRCAPCMLWSHVFSSRLCPRAHTFAASEADWRRGRAAGPACQRCLGSGDALAVHALPAILKTSRRPSYRGDPTLLSCSRAVDRPAAGAEQQALPALAAVRAALAAAGRLEAEGLACRAWAGAALWWVAAQPRASSTGASQST